ncbi:Soluble aldose sugar dehydrogenase YliI precursor [compost metagenome]
MRKRILLNLALGVGALASGAKADPLPHPLAVPKGFAIAPFIEGLPGLRFMAVSPAGDLTVSRPSKGEILVLPDRNRDGRADRVVVFASGLDRPHGLAWRDGALYVAETGAILKLEDTNGDGKADRKQVLSRDLPAGGMHWTRTLGFGPDGGLYVAAGSDCNVCIEKDERRATIMRFEPDGSRRRIFAKGLRNAVGFVWHPETKALWATDNGRDWLGNDQPPDELNLVKEGAHYGWPYCWGDRHPDPDLGDPALCAKTVPPALAFQAHSAALGLAFYTGAQFPADYRGDAFVAFHGSWNRQPPTGYKVVRVRFRGGKPVSYEDFATGWLRGGEAWGRPVDVLQAPDGSLMVSDDAGGRIYRVTYPRSTR